MVSGSEMFISQKGVQYLLDHYLDPSDLEELKRYNTPYARDQFRKKLIEKIEKGSYSRGWIPPNYEDELIENAGAIIGSSRERGVFKNGRETDVYQTPGGRRVWEDSRGRIRDFGTGRFTSKDVFTE